LQPKGRKKKRYVANMTTEYSIELISNMAAQASLILGLSLIQRRRLGSKRIGAFQPSPFCCESHSFSAPRRPSHSQRCQRIPVILTHFALSQSSSKCMRRWSSRAVEYPGRTERKRGRKGRGKSEASTRMVTIKADDDR
jgi:hypothetical protein